MKKIFLLVMTSLTTMLAIAQNITFGDDTNLIIGSSASLYLGGDATFNGTLDNEGTIISYSDLNFVE
ncbi:MAG: hypothetical protein AAF551_13710, partial [Bacteroidota bacterium]